MSTKSFQRGVRQDPKQWIDQVESDALRRNNLPVPDQMYWSVLGETIWKPATAVAVTGVNGQVHFVAMPQIRTVCRFVEARVQLVVGVANSLLSVALFRRVNNEFVMIANSKAIFDTSGSAGLLRKTLNAPVTLYPGEEVFLGYVANGGATGAEVDVMTSTAARVRMTPVLYNFQNKVPIGDTSFGNPTFRVPFVVYLTQRALEYM